LAALSGLGVASQQQRQRQQQRQQSTRFAAGPGERGQAIEPISDAAADCRRGGRPPGGSTMSTGRKARRLPTPRHNGQRPKDRVRLS
jgi:hypothetical protein